MAKANVDCSGVLYGAEVARKWCGVYKHDYTQWKYGVEAFWLTYGYEFTKNQKKLGIYKSDADARMLLEEIFFHSEWLKYKKVYDFNKTFVKYLAEMDTQELRADILKKLPYKSFYMSINDYPMIKTTLRDGRDEWVKGLIVHWYFKDDMIQLGVSINYADATVKTGADWREWFTFLTFKDGDKFENVLGINVRDREDWLRQNNLNPDELEEAAKLWDPFMRIAINGSYYLCASNAEIKEVKTPKKDRWKTKQVNAKRPIALQTSQVGYRLGTQFEKMYREASESSERIGRTGARKRPHVRRAHWHHYWTGPGRTILEVKWLEPVFVMAQTDDIDTVIHQVSGK